MPRHQTQPGSFSFSFEGEGVGEIRNNFPLYFTFTSFQSTIVCLIIATSKLFLYTVKSHFKAPPGFKPPLNISPSICQQIYCSGYNPSPVYKPVYCISVFFCVSFMLPRRPFFTANRQIEYVKACSFFIFILFRSSCSSRMSRFYRCF